MPESAPAVTLEDVRAAAARIAPHVLRTPLLPCEPPSRALGFRLLVKAESLQPTGSFKVRGASNAVFGASDEQIVGGVLTHSSGNHAAAVARAAACRGVPAHIVMPENSGPAKIANVRAEGAEPVFCGPTGEDRQAAADRLRAETGALFVHPYDQPAVIAGQGTMGLELLKQAPEVEVIVIPVGGGGMAAGVLTAVKALRPDVRVVGAEPAAADDAHRSLEAGRRLPPTRYDTVADGLRTGVGALTFPILRALLDDLVLVGEEEILAATAELSASSRLVLEPSGGVAYAAAKTLSGSLSGRTVAVIACGGNR